jgi:hypothetical protein
MILVYLNFTIELGDGASTISLFPSFIGYFLMLKGLSEVSEFGVRFVRLKPYVKVAMIYTGIAYIIDLLGIVRWMVPFPAFILSLALALLATVLSLFIAYTIIMGIKDIELEKEQHLGSERLYLRWKLLAVFTLLSYSAFFLMPMVAFLIMLSGFIVALFYLLAFKGTRRLFYQQNSEGFNN